MKRTMVLTILVFLLSVQANWGDIPETISYQGLLTDASGTPVSDGAYELTFSIYDVDTGGTELWSENHSSVAVSNGIFSVILGSINPLDIPFDRQYWLGVRIDMGPELEPRTRLTSSAYSLGGDFWRLSGNAGTNPTTNFLGTADNQPLELRVFGACVLRLEPHSASPNIVGGYSGNSVSSGVYGATIGGGGASGGVNQVTDNYGVVGGGRQNRAGDNAGNTNDNPFATVGGGLMNTASGSRATVGGGGGNTASGAFATVGGGNNNDTSGEDATVGGGGGNTASGSHATVGGGYSNTASGENATIGGGQVNTASGDRATVPGGWQNTAQGDYSFAAGLCAKANHAGSFVWSGANVLDEPNFLSVASREFAVRCAGGARFVTQYNSSTGAPTKWAYLNPSTAQWEVKTSSDVNLKDSFAPVDGVDILKHLASMPVQTWSYSGEDVSIRHIGPTSQDFYAAFGMGRDDGTIGVLDAEGVALAAIQELYGIVKEKEAEIAELRERLAELEKLVK